MRYRPRVDANQKEIVHGLRQIGCLVVSLAGVGKGVPDLLVQFRDRIYLLEVKDGRKSASRKKLTEDERVFHLLWKVNIVESFEEACKTIGAF